MSTKTTVVINLSIIASLICVVQSQLPSTTTILGTQEFTSITSKYVVIVGDAGFNWFGGHDICDQNGYVMSQINNTQQHQEIADIILSSGKQNTDCWLGAFGFFISNAWWWTWDAFDGDIPWNETFASQLIVVPSAAVDITRTQGMIIRVDDNNNAIWSYTNADLPQLCVVCLDLNRTLNATTTTSLSPNPVPTTGPTSTPTASTTTTAPSLITASIPTLIPSVSPSVNPTSFPSPSPVPSTSESSVPSTSPSSVLPTTSPNTVLSSTSNPSENPTNTPLSSNPTRSPTNTPTTSPTTALPTYNWDNLDANTGEIKLDQLVHQNCTWRDLECGHCLEKLRIAIVSPEEHTDELLEQTHGGCQCFGGFGMEQTTENNKTVLIVHTKNTSITFQEREDGDHDSDDITVTITNWRGVYDRCELEFYVNRNAFLGIKARNVLKVEFDLTGIDDVDAFTLNTHQSRYNLVHLLRNYFSNDSVAMEEANNVTVHITNDDTDETNRRLIDDDLSVSVIIFTDSGEYARVAKSDLEHSMSLSHGGWSHHIQDIIHNQTGDITNVSNVKYTLLSSDQLDDLEVEIPDEDTENEENEEEEADKLPKKAVIGGTLLVVIVFCSVLVSIVIVTYVVYSYCKDKHRMAYQKPEVTRDNISELQETSECEGDCEEEGEMDENQPMLQTNYPFNISQRVDLNLNVSHRVKKRQLHALNDELEAEDDLVLYPGGKTPLDHMDAKDILGTVTTDELRSEMAETASSFSVKTSVINFDLDSNMDLDELIPSMIHKVCNSNYTHLIHHDELWIEHVIGRGHYGEVYVAKYDGNKVAVKTFKQQTCDISLASDKENNENEDIKAFQIDDNVEYHNAAVKKATYARRKEIYSEVVLAASLPSHPNIVQILGITQDPLNIVMTYYEGGNLRDFIYKNSRKYGLISMNSIVNLMQKIADGILFLHNNKIVHRDIATRNVLLGHIERDGQIRENTQVVISDFGMTRCMTMQYVAAEQQTKQKIGAVKWMAPESIIKQKYSYKTDVYMFGMTMFEIMHGKEPFTSSTYQNLTLPILAIKIAKKSQRPIINETEELNSILSSNDLNLFVIQKINKLIRSCWDKSPLNRPTMLTVLHELNSIYDSMLGLS